MKTPCITVILIYTVSIALSCSDEIHREETDEDDDIKGCLLWNEIIDGYLCVDATKRICQFRSGEAVSEKCSDRGLPSCENGIWTESYCPYDEKGACTLADEAEDIVVCVSAYKTDCVRLYPDGEWMALSCAENGFEYFCNDVDAWTGEESECPTEVLLLGACIVYDDETEIASCSLDGEDACEETLGEWYALISCPSAGFPFVCDDGFKYESSETCLN